MNDKRPKWLQRMDPGNLLARLDTTPSCDCATCAPDYEFFRVCGECGNKRCPKATCHTHECSRSNLSGQIGSTYGATLCGMPKCKCVQLHIRETRERAEWDAEWGAS